MDNRHYLILYYISLPLKQLPITSLLYIYIYIYIYNIYIYIIYIYIIYICIYVRILISSIYTRFKTKIHNHQVRQVFGTFLCITDHTETQSDILY